MIARTLPETMAGMPCDFSHRGSRVIVRGRAPWQAPQIGAGVGRMAREVTSKILDGINDLVIMAPIREGFISAYEPVTYATRSEEHTSELQSLMRISYAVFCLKKKKQKQTHRQNMMRQNRLV